MTTDPRSPRAPCCAAERGAGRAKVPAAVPDPGPRRIANAERDTMVSLPGGTFLMCTDEVVFPDDGEGPVREVAVSPFATDRHAVSNARFAAFVKGSGYVTEAERFGSSFVFVGLLPESFADTPAVVGATWWREVAGADWRHPVGPGSGIEDRMDHPVVHVTWNDAAAYAAWSGLRLPTEAECEYAAREGSSRRGSPGGTSSRLAGGTCATSGRAPSRPSTRSTTDISAPHPWTRSRQTRSVSTTSSATSGSGARTCSNPPAWQATLG
jgi:formylglycine-generating enzyme